MKDPLSHIFKKELTRLLRALQSEKEVKGLAAKRDQLFEYFAGSGTHLPGF
jgi:hypothetical protein